MGEWRRAWRNPRLVVLRRAAALGDVGNKRRMDRQSDCVGTV